MKKLFLCMAAAALLSACTQKPDDEPRAEGSVEIDLRDETEAFKKAVNKTEDAIKDGAKEAGKKLESAGESIKENFEAAKEKLSDDKNASIEVEVKKD